MIIAIGNCCVFPGRVVSAVDSWTLCGLTYSVGATTTLEVLCHLHSAGEVRRVEVTFHDLLAGQRSQDTGGHRISICLCRGHPMLGEKGLKVLLRSPSVGVSKRTPLWSCFPAPPSCHNEAGAFRPDLTEALDSHPVMLPWAHPAVTGRQC